MCVTTLLSAQRAEPSTSAGPLGGDSPSHWTGGSQSELAAVAPRPAHPRAGASPPRVRRRRRRRRLPKVRKVL